MNESSRQYYIVAYNSTRVHRVEKRVIYNPVLGCPVNSKLCCMDSNGHSSLIFQLSLVSLTSYLLQGKSRSRRLLCHD